MIDRSYAKVGTIVLQTISQEMEKSLSLKN